eukprot:GFKZ01007840.1.p1 GENE.GFKZ01007840.1~~GFKZ01007840.1.p1  ORF type:complete len:337 (+),score=37.96 GFKZ01007840.1:978-1988(+)
MPPVAAFAFPAPFTPLFVAALAASAEALSRRRERRPPPGKLLPVYKSHRRVHVVYHNPLPLHGAPCVILEAGANSWSPMWAQVASRLGEFARVFRYDRAGYGFSDGSTGEGRSVAQVAAELGMLLDAVGASPPYVLVAHSLGALYINRLIMTLDPRDVWGVVYVDAASPETVRMLEKVVPRVSPPTWLARVLGWLGVLRLLAPMALTPYLREFQAGLREEAMATWARGEWLVAYTTEWTDVMRGVKGTGMKFEEGWLGELPIAVLVPDVYERTEGKAYVGELQAAIACYSSDATVIEVSDCGHFIQLERPDVVVGAVKNVISRAKGKSGVQGEGGQ